MPDMCKYIYMYAEWTVTESIEIIDQLQRQRAYMNKVVPGKV